MQKISAGWEIRCEAVQELVPARCIFCPLKHPENKQAGIWERQKDSESLHPSGPLSHLPHCLSHPWHPVQEETESMDRSGLTSF